MGGAISIPQFINTGNLQGKLRVLRVYFCHSTAQTHQKPLKITGNKKKRDVLSMANPCARLIRGIEPFAELHYQWIKSIGDWSTILTGKCDWTIAELQQSSGSSCIVHIDSFLICC
jgi:hypothetical protein